jgi:hypothetical protein
MPPGRVAWFIAGAAWTLPLLSYWTSPAFTPLLKLLPVMIIALAAASPVRGLGLLAVLGPISVPLHQWLGAPPVDSLAIFELLVISTLAGVCLRRGLRPTEVMAGAPNGASWVFGTVIAASALVVCSVDPVVFVSPEHPARLAWVYLTHDYFTDPTVLPAWHHAMIWLQSLSLAALVSHEVRRRPEAGAALAGLTLVGFAAQAFFSWDRLAQIALRDPAPIAAWFRHVVSIRISPHIADINATGSVLALAAAGWVVWLLVPSISSRWRIVAALGATLSVGGLWMTHSRSALLAAALVCVVAWLRLQRPRLRTIGICLAVAAGVAATVLATNLMRVSQAPAGRAAEIRHELITTGLKMSADHPWFGVGIAQFQRRSVEYTSPRLQKIFPQSLVGENAHNQLVQVLGELGVVGLAAFLAYWTVLFLPLVTRGRRWPMPAPLVACVGALTAFLLSAMLGHPLLTARITLTVFFVVGVVAGLTPSPSPAHAVRRRWITAACMLAIVISIPFRVLAARRGVDLDNFVGGASAVAGERDGVRYRIAEAHSVWLVRSDARTVEIPLRANDGECAVSVTVDGRAADHVRVTTDRWHRVRFTFHEPETRWATRRIDINTSPGTCGLLVGRPVVVG